MGETNSDVGLQFPTRARLYVSYILPVIIIYILFQGYIEKLAELWNILIPSVLLPLMICVSLQAWRKKGANNKNT